MKKLILLIAIFLAGAMSYSKSDKEEKPNENKKINAPASSNIKEENYEAGMVQRMEAIKKEVQPALNSGVTADMNDAIQKLGESWETEMRKIYDLLLSELPKKEKVELQEEQEKWAKKIKEEIAKDAEELKRGTTGTFNVLGTALGNTEKRALELAKRYDKLHPKK